MLKYLAIILIFFNFSCSYKPVLDENYKYQNTPQKIIDEDIDECEEKADNHLKGLKARRAGKEAVRKGVIGAFFGAIFGIFTGDPVRVIKSAGVGAGVGASVGAASVAGEGKVTPDQIKQRYVTRCLNEKGYSIIGWE